MTSSTRTGLLIVLLLVGSEPVWADEAPLEMRLGIVSYESGDELLRHAAAIFADVKTATGRPVEVRPALGTYAEVLHWVRRGTVDVAVLSPGLYAEVLAAERAGEDRSVVYLATEALDPERLPWAPGATEPGPRFSYRSLAVVRRGSSLVSVEDLRAGVARGAVELLFVEPLSAGGHLAARHALRTAGISLDGASTELTYAHSRSLERVADYRPGAGPEPVAFVFDGASSPRVDARQELARLPFPELESIEIPADVWVARADLEEATWLAGALATLTDAEGRARFRREPAAHEARYTPLAAFKEEADVRSDAPLGIDEIVRQLRHDAEIGARPPRLGLVLSGGGAKCAYQVGAVSAIEERLGVERSEHPTDTYLDLGLVVGTSGGALNALPVAMGVTSTPEGRRLYQSVWRRLDLKRMVAPSPAVGATIGLWLAGLQVAIWYGVRRAIGKGSPRAWAAAALGALVGLLVPGVALAPTRWFGLSQLRYLSLWWSFGMAYAIPSLPIIIVVAASVVRRGSLTLRRRAVLASVVLMVGLPLLTLAALLFSAETLFHGSGMERAIAASFDRLSRSMHPSGVDGAHEPPTLPALSRTIVDGGLVVRDLVVTGAGLPPARPADRYFYLPAAAGNHPPPSFGARGVDLRARPELLLDVVMGSGSIYPIFPPRPLPDFPGAGREVRMVDGGFAHNSPVEAAVLWGATHVVLIEASAKAERGTRAGTLLSSGLEAFHFLYDQAQLTDVRTRERVVIYTLRPRPPHVSVLDFAPACIDAAIAAGVADASSRSFARQDGEPRFLPPLAGGR